MNIKHLALLAAATMFAACGGRNNTAHEHDHEGHAHTTHTHEAHSHEGHNHNEHDHEGHDHSTHSHEGHTHAEHETHAEHSHEGHNHDTHGGHEGHDHSAEAHADGEIVFSAEQAEAAGLQTEVLKAADFAEVIATSGVVESAPINRTAVVAPASGVLTLRNIYVGSRVHKGQVLATLSGRRIAEGDPAEQVRIDYELARKEWERAGRLVEQKIISEQEYDRLTSAYETARRRYEALASEDGEGIVVKSPVDGYVVACDAANGDYVQTGAVLFTVTAGNRMTLTADLPVGKIDRLGAISSANFVLPYSDKVYSMAELGGRIEAVGRCADGAAYLPVTFVFNAPAEVLSGTFAEVWLVGSTNSGVVSVPKEALTEEQGLHFVYVRLDSECYRKQEVRTIATDGHRVAIEGTDLEGLEIVTRGVYQVKLAANASIIPEGHSHNH
ncbi:MAG: efflux RND transporter periplasmic adaptor subunit [Rikenellaceae bacterium]|nr:efflux RND transporter periplasmic adaptor subunit [Rikenellaceae bacterium]